MTDLVEQLWSREAREVWIPRVFVAISIVLVPWIAWLFVSLPDEARAAHWRFAWGGFDVGLAAALVVTAYTLHRGLPTARIAAVVTGTMLVCDAWFDVLTSHGATSVTMAAALAVVAELPLAALCFAIGSHVPGTRPPS